MPVTFFVVTSESRIPKHKHNHRHPAVSVLLLWYLLQGLWRHVGGLKRRSKVTLRGVGASAPTPFPSPGVAFTLKALLLFHDTWRADICILHMREPPGWWGLIYMMAFAFDAPSCCVRRLHTYCTLFMNISCSWFSPLSSILDDCCCLLAMTHVFWLYLLFVFGTFVMLGFTFKMLCMLID